MANSKREIPKSLDECRRVDGTADAVWSWAEWFEVWGKRLLIGLSIVGIISTIVAAVQVADVDEDLVFMTVLTSLLTWGLYALIEFVVYRFIAILLYAFGSIVQSVRITSNVALYSNSTASKNNVNTSAANTTWLCQCGTRNPGSSKFCTGCGKPHP